MLRGEVHVNGLQHWRKWLKKLVFWWCQKGKKVV